MSFKITAIDDAALAAAIATILNAYLNSEVSEGAACGALMQIVVLAANDETETFRAWLQPEQLAAWKTGVVA